MTPRLRRSSTSSTSPPARPTGATSFASVCSRSAPTTSSSLPGRWAPISDLAAAPLRGGQRLGLPQILFEEQPLAQRRIADIELEDQVPQLSDPRGKHDRSFVIVDLLQRDFDT